MKPLYPYARIKDHLRFVLFSLFALIPLVAIPQSRAQTYTLLRQFYGASSGYFPVGTMLIDSEGSLYGVTQFGESFPNGGTLYKVAPGGTEQAFHLSGAGLLGYPISSLVADDKGNLYGSSGYPSYGVIYEISSDGTIRAIYSFLEGQNEWYPSGDIARDGEGNIYGVMELGGTSCVSSGGCGLVFKVTPEGLESVLHNFADDLDGAYPAGGVTLAPNGDLYGTTVGGGAGVTGRSCGTIFKIDRFGVYRVLFRFNGGNGCAPFAPLIFDSAGNAYGTTSGGSNDCGTVFELTPSEVVKVLYSFGPYRSADGCGPQAGVVLDAAGNLYGTTTVGGSYDQGTVFELQSTGTESILYNFTGRSDGGYPISGLTLDSHGNLYGSTFSGGVVDGECQDIGQDIGCGTVFKIMP